MKNVMRRTLTGVSLAAGVILLLKADQAFAPGWIVWGVQALMIGGCIYELARMEAYRRLGLGIPLAVTFVLGAAVALCIFVDLGPANLRAWADAPAMQVVLWSWGASAVVAGCLALVFGGNGARRQDVVLWNAAAGAWIIAPLPIIAWLFHEHGHGGIGALILLAKIGDIFAYFVGRRFGKHHPFPRTSPNKTIEGCLASVLGAVLAGALLGTMGLLDIDPLSGAAAGLVVNLVAQAADLLESRVKRAADVKDSGTLLGPAGGFLDVVDSLLLAVPAAVLLIACIAELNGGSGV